MDMGNIFDQNCTKCTLSLSRTQIVQYRGNPRSKLMLIGEGPGRQEDLQGKPFVGRSGALLDEALVASFGSAFLEYIYITNLVKCRPPGNRNPTSFEINDCSFLLKKEFETIKPNLIVVMGKVSAEEILQRPVTITKEHGNLNFLNNGKVVMVCYHPAYVLRNQTTEIKNSFFQAFHKARRIAYETNAGFKLSTGSLGRTHPPLAGF